MQLKRKLVSGLLAGAAMLFAGAQPALAGHLNPVLEADLDGRSEVANGATNSRVVGDPNGRGEAYVFGIDGDPFTLCYLLVSISNIDGLAMPPGGGRAAHIHEGASGSNGPVVANLAWPQDGQAADCLTEGERLPNGALAFPTGEPGIVRRILNNGEGFYINIHNPEFPSGAIRGQLEYSH